jgi:hypothetical protein
MHLMWLKTLAPAGIVCLLFATEYATLQIVCRVGIRRWNCAISLRPLKHCIYRIRFEVNVRYSDWDVKSTLPHGIRSDSGPIWINVMDNVPLLRFSSLPIRRRIRREMFDIFHGVHNEVVMC